MADPDRILENGYVTVQNGKIVAVGRGRGGPGPVTDHGPGVLMPALVNAHTHLELSALKGRTQIREGFAVWVRSVIKAKEALGETDLKNAMMAGIAELTRTGTAAIGDIANLDFSRLIFRGSSLSGVQFKEYLGSHPENLLPCETLSDAKHLSLAGHALHTTTPDLLRRLKAAARAAHLPFSLHLAESAAEMEFLDTGKGSWRDFLAERGLDSKGIFSLEKGGGSPVARAQALGLLDATTLAVHLVFADKKDIRRLAENRVSVCLCPRSNLMLHQKLPDVAAMAAENLHLCLGTDSLASNASLNLFEEMACLANSVPGLSPGRILSMATKNGAEALCLGHRLGRLAPQFLAKMLYAPVAAKTPEDVLAALVSGQSFGSVKCLF